jgi:predicted phage gp36 major capsid-like protein
LTTPDGEVKTKVYTITLNDAQVKSLEENALTILSKDEKLKASFERVMEKKADQTKRESFEEFINKAKEQLKEDTVESFQYTAYVDIDGYIVNETVEVKIKREAAEQGKPKSIRFSLEMKNWDINKDQKFEFPVLTDENTMKSTDLDQTMPSLFKDLFQAR